MACASSAALFAHECTGSAPHICSLHLRIYVGEIEPHEPVSSRACRWSFFIPSVFATSGKSLFVS